MKRIVCIILIFTTLLLACSCAKQNLRLKEPVDFYYKARHIQYDTAENVISSEQREGFGHTDDYKHLIEQYLYGPRSAKCISPFPAGTTLEQLDLLKNKTIIVVSSHLSLLSGYELTIACTCMAKTVAEITDVEKVQIISKDSLLDGQESITLDTDDLIFEDIYIPQD